MARAYSCLQGARPCPADVPQARSLVPCTQPFGLLLARRWTEKERCSCNARGREPPVSQDFVRDGQQT